MEITMCEITIREVVDGYVDNAEEGIKGYGGKLNIRPKYQREFVYDETRRNAVIKTIRQGFPLNTMYWVDNGDGEYELLDGQQRTISFCQYVNGDFSIDGLAFHNLTKGEQDQILNYKLSVYICKGTDKEKLDWFTVVNIAGMQLTDQELRNITYTGTWLSDAKLKFSKTNCAAQNLAGRYINGSAIRQELLEVALDWISEGNIKEYMSKHQKDPNANELWIYFRNVIEWVELTFPQYRKEMKGIRWGELYHSYGKKLLDTRKLEQEIQKLMMDDDVTNKKGIYYYVLTRNEKFLNIRAFTESQKRTVYERQKGICKKCNAHFEFEEMEADHVKPWSEGGSTSIDNCYMLCKGCNRKKSNK